MSEESNNDSKPALKPKRPPGRRKGTTKTGGRVKGTRNKATLAREKLLAEAFAKRGLDFFAVLSDAIKEKEVDWVRTLQYFMPYFLASYKAVEPPKQSDVATEQVKAASSQDLLAYVTKAGK